MSRPWSVLAAFVAACSGPSSSPPDAERADAPAPDATIDAPIVEPLPDPAAIAGPLTIATWGTRPFLTPAAIDDVLDSRFSLGREFFVATWTEAPNAQRPNLDGVGPLFHAPSCVACHPEPGRPASLLAGGAVGAGLLLRLAGASGPDPIFGGQLQPAAIAGHAAEATITYTTPEPPPAGIAAASARPVFVLVTDASYGALAPSTYASPRLAPHLAGMGLLEAVDDATLLAREDPDDLDGDGVSGRAARLPGGALGRFGWKAVQPDLRGQTTAAFAGDVGITSSAHPADDCTAAQPACLAAPSGGAPEIADADVDAVDIFMRLLGVPAARRDNADPQIVRGHAAFVAAGCDACHASTLVTGADATPAVLANVTFHAYTDLLLHDLGPALAAPIGEGDATAGEWRTPPLWGLGLVAAQPDARFLHDGRAATLADAIRWHGGEAERARAAFAALSPDDAEALLAFLASL